MRLDDGYRIVQLLTPNSLDREGSAMGNCVGNGEFDLSVAAGTSLILSLRDPNNKPHATLEIDVTNNSLLQCQGKGNKLAETKYLERLTQFVEKRNIHLPTIRTGQTGLLRDASGKVHSLFVLPSNLRFNQTLYLSRTQITGLPDGLQVTGDLYLRDTPLTSLPKRLYVGGTLDLRYTKIAELPGDINVRGQIHIYGTPASKVLQKHTVACISSRTPRR